MQTKQLPHMAILYSLLFSPSNPWRSLTLLLSSSSKFLLLLVGFSPKIKKCFYKQIKFRGDIEVLPLRAKKTDYDNLNFLMTRPMRFVHLTNWCLLSSYFEIIQGKTLMDFLASHLYLKPGLDGNNSTKQTHCPP